MAEAQMAPLPRKSRRRAEKHYRVVVVVSRLDVHNVLGAKEYMKDLRNAADPLPVIFIR